MASVNQPIGTKGIASVLSSYRHKVPVYQRSFVWTEKEEQVREFLTDISEAYYRKGEEYFLGSIVVISPKENNPAEVVDGQQRLAVTSLLISQIANKFEELGKKKSCQKIIEEFIESSDYKEEYILPQFRLNRVDDIFYQKLLHGDIAKPPSSSPPSHARLWEAYNRIDTWLSEQLSSKDKPIDWLAEFLEYLKNSAYVIYFVAPDESNAFLIFETLNDRGLDLSVSDLVKNYLLGKAKDNIDAVLDSWNYAFNTVRVHGGEDVFKTFLRQFWMSKHGLVRKKELYKDIKSRVTTAPTAIEFADELQHNSYLYDAILSPDHSSWVECSVKTRENLSALINLGLEQYRPTLLSALVIFEMDEVEKLLKLLVSWSVRLLIVGRMGGGTIENNYGDLGMKIRKGILKNVKDIAKHANKIFVPFDGEFKDSFEKAQVSKPKLARYYLRTLELEAGGEDQREFIPNPDASELTLEHILPENPAKGEWQDFDDEERKLYTTRIGNLTLLTEKMNSNVRNGPFKEKKQYYTKSSLLLTKQIATFDKWNKESINDRQRYLAKLALKAWSIGI